MLFVWLTTPTAPSFALMANCLLCACALTAAIDAMSLRLDFQALGYLAIALLYNPILPLPELLVPLRWQMDLPCVLFLIAPRLKKREPLYLMR